MSCKGFKAQFLRRDFCRLCFKARDEHKTPEQLEAERLAALVTQETVLEQIEVAKKVEEEKQKALKKERERKLAESAKKPVKPQDDPLLDESLDSTFTDDLSDDDMVYESAHGILADAQAALRGAMASAMDTGAIDVNELDLDDGQLSSLTYTEGDVDSNASAFARPASYSSTDQVHSIKLSQSDNIGKIDGKHTDEDTYTSSIISEEEDSLSLSGDAKDLAAQRLAAVDAMIAKGSPGGVDEEDKSSYFSSEAESEDSMMEGSSAEAELLREKPPVAAQQDGKVEAKAEAAHSEGSYVSSIESSVVSSDEEQGNKPPPAAKEPSKTVNDEPATVIPEAAAVEESEEGSDEFESSFETSSDGTDLVSSVAESSEQDAAATIVDLVKECMRATKALVTFHGDDDFGTTADDFESKCLSLTEALAAAGRVGRVTATINAEIEPTIRACSAVLGNPSETNLNKKEFHAGAMSDALREVLNPSAAADPSVAREVKSEAPKQVISDARSVHISVEATVQLIKLCLRSTANLVTVRDRESLAAAEAEFTSNCSYLLRILENRAQVETDSEVKAQLVQVHQKIQNQTEPTLRSCKAIIEDDSEMNLDQRDSDAHAMSSALRKAATAMSKVQDLKLRETPIHDEATLIETTQDAHFTGVVHFKDKEAASRLSELLESLLKRSQSIHDVSYSSEKLPQELMKNVDDIVDLLDNFVANSKTEKGGNQSKDCIFQIKKRQGRLRFVISDYNPKEPWTIRQKYVIGVSLKAILGNLKMLMNISEREAVEAIVAHIKECLRSTKSIVSAQSDREFAPLADDFTSNCLMLTKILDHRLKIITDAPVKHEMSEINDKIRSEIRPTVASCEAVIKNATEATLDSRDARIHSMSSALREAADATSHAVAAVSEFKFQHEDSDQSEQSVSLVTSESDSSSADEKPTTLVAAVKTDRSAVVSEEEYMEEESWETESSSSVDKDEEEEEEVEGKAAEPVKVASPVERTPAPSKAVVREKSPEKVNPLVGIIAVPQAKPHCVDMEDGSEMICRCGQSKTFPLCDGSHVAYNAKHGTEYSPWEADPAILGSIVYICGCGESERRNDQGVPLCDGTHSSLPATHRSKMISSRVRHAGFSDRGTTKTKAASHEDSTSQSFDTSSSEEVGRFAMSGKIRSPTSGPHSVSLTGESPIYVCRCGQSNSFPLCDGSHGAFNEKHGTLFSPWRADPVELGEDVIHVCGCGKSKKRHLGVPLCDDSHKTLPGYKSSEESEDKHQEKFERTVSALIPKMPTFGVQQPKPVEKTPIVVEAQPAPPSTESQENIESDSSSTEPSVEKAVVVAKERTPRRQQSSPRQTASHKSPRRKVPVAKKPLKERQLQTADVYRAPKREADAHALPASQAIIDELFESSEDDVYVSQDIRQRLARLEAPPVSGDGTLTPLRIETLYCSKWDPASASVRYVLYAKKLSIRIKFVESSSGVMESPWDTLPCFITESGAALTSPSIIISFLLDKYKSVRPKMLSKVPENRYKSLMVGNICERDLDALFYLYPSPSLNKLHRRRRPTMRSRDKEKVFQDHLRHLDNLETFLSARGPFVAGKVLGIGDAVMLPYFLYYTEYMRRLSKVVFEGRPKLKAWWDKIRKQDPAMRIIEEINRSVFEKAKNGE